MKILQSRTVWYPSFAIGSEPRAVRCEIHVVEANKRRYLKTPFAFLNHQSGDLECATLPGHGYYATEADCMAYIAREYPHWQLAQPIMERWYNDRHHYGPIVGDGRAAERCEVSTFHIAQLARGHRAFTLKTVKAALSALKK